jgi:hypothetical protein
MNYLIFQAQILGANEFMLIFILFAFEYPIYPKKKLIA